MTATPRCKEISNTIAFDTSMSTWKKAFLKDRKAQGLSLGTIEFYTKKLSLFENFCEASSINQITQITPDFIREFMHFLENEGHNPGGKHAYYRVIRTFLYWWEEEVEPEGWSNPIRKTKAPKVPIVQLASVNLDDIKALIDTCDKSFHGLRDKAIFLTLFDTGVRANELIDMKMDDLNPVSGEIVIRRGKGSKYRTVFLGKTSRRATRAYLKARSDDCTFLWVTEYGDPLTYGGLRGIAQRRSIDANVPTPSLHSFRRAFAINMSAGNNTMSQRVQ